MNNSINNLFIQAINNKDTRTFVAYFELPNNKIGKTAEYSKLGLDMIIEEAESFGHKLLKIVEVSK